VQEKIARVRVAKLAAATTIFSVVAAATATPTHLHTETEEAILSAVEPANATRELKVGSVEIANLVDTVRIERPAKGDLQPVGYRTFIEAEDLPSSGQVATFEITGLHNDMLPASSFSQRSVQAASLEEESDTYSAFSNAEVEARSTVVVARLPSPRPKINVAQKFEGESVETSRVLAYAPATSSLDAPFDAVLADEPNEIAIPDESKINVPRPRPDPEMVLNWLDGRALGQFAPDQHDWVKNPLPEGVHSASEQKCLAEGIYHEARGEPEAGQAAVAQVILNRVRAPAYPDTICGVVYQNKSWRNRCQFSFACDGIADKVRSGPAWSTARRIASDVTDGKVWIEEVGDSTHYYADYVSPRWARTMNKMEQIGAHLFYRTRRGGWS
jgi:spore germination cell wall hydrolase CwlJ-like protein